MQVLLLRLSVLFSVKHSTCIIVTPLQMATTDHFMQQHRLDVYFKDVAVIGCQKAVADEDLDAFRAAYFQTVAQGNHVIGTQHNRSCFCNHARQALEQCASVGELSIVDLQSILQFICPDFPLGLVKNAFTPAQKLHGMPGPTNTWNVLDIKREACGRGDVSHTASNSAKSVSFVGESAEPEDTGSPESPGTHGQQKPPKTPAAVSPQLYAACFLVTFLCEQHLMDIRKACFDRHKNCNDMQALRTNIMDITAAAAVKGCHCIRVNHLEDAIDMIEGEQCTFGDLLRHLCNSLSLQEELRAHCSRGAQL